MRTLAVLVLAPIVVAAVVWAVTVWDWCKSYDRGYRWE